MIDENAPHVIYEPVVSLQCYGKDKIFGEYHIETGELKITDPSMIDIDLEMLRRDLDKWKRNGTPMGSHMLFGVPKEVYTLREKFRDQDMRSH
jgi:hypothetical protein